MAKLSAYGQKEVARLERVIEDSDALVSQRRDTYAFMSNGRVLKKADVVWRADGKRHSYGWKVLPKKLPLPEDRAAAIERLKLLGFEEA